MDKHLVRDWMSSNPFTVSPQSTLLEADSLMTARHVRRLPVVEAGHLVGILTLGDIRTLKPSEAMVLSVFDAPNALGHLSVEQAMTPTVVTTTPDTNLGDAARLMLNHKIGGLPVMDGEQLIGVITVSDLYRALGERGAAGMPAQTVQQWMTPDPVSIGPKTKLPDVRCLMKERNVRHVPVVEHNRLLGIVSLGDVRGAEPSPYTTLSSYELTYVGTLMHVCQIMYYAPITVSPTASSYEAAALMRTHKIGCLPVIADNRLVGIITESDMLRLASRAFGPQTA